jgi:hypothetical protein
MIPVGMICIIPVGGVVICFFTFIVVVLIEMRCSSVVSILNPEVYGS